MANWRTVTSDCFLVIKQMIERNVILWQDVALV